MGTEYLFNKIKNELIHQISFLEDKPEENIESTIKALWLKACGIPKSSEEAHKTVLPDLSEEQKEVLNDLVKQRIACIPLAHITGRQNFMGIEMLCDSRALIPRKETEILGKAALEICHRFSRIKNKPLVLDICCGSGNLGLALGSHCPNIQVYASDLSEDAIKLATENSHFLNLNDRVTVLHGNLFEPFESEDFYNQVDIIVCNPPYISSSKVTKLNAEIANNEPTLAFDGGMLGTKIIQKLIQEAPRFLINGGSLIFEVGAGQGEFICNLCKKTGIYNKINGINDSNGGIRVVHCTI